MNMYRVVEFAYLAVAGFFLYEAVRVWDQERDQAYLFLLFCIIGIFMFFFKRHFRHKYRNRNK